MMTTFDISELFFSVQLIKLHIYPIIMLVNSLLYYCY
jgi:hypothetical protein